MATRAEGVTTRTGRAGGFLGFHMTRGRGVSWGAVFAGLLIGTALQIVLTMFGVAIGLGAADDSAKAAGIGTGIWAVVAALIAAWVGGRGAGATARARERGDGAFHGILAWALSTVLFIWLVSSGAGKLIGGAANLAGNVAGGAVAGATQGAATRPGAVQNAAQNAQANANDPAVQQRIDSAQQNVAEAADTARKVAKSAAWLALLGMGLTAAASAFGGASAARDDDDDEVVVARTARV